MTEHNVMDLGLSLSSQPWRYLLCLLMLMMLMMWINIHTQVHRIVAATIDANVVHPESGADIHGLLGEELKRFSGGGVVAVGQWH